MSTITYEVTGLTCGGCVNRVTQTLAALSKDVKVTLDPPQAVLTDPSADFNALNLALSQVGSYQLLPLQTLHMQSAGADLGPEAPTKSWLATYYPLLLIIGFIALIATLAQINLQTTFAGLDGALWMRHFMAGFFMVFAFFKLLDIKSFANSYAMYDLLAKRLKAYGLIYPFIELGLGIAYLINWQPMLTNIATFIVMIFSSIGVIKSVLNQQKIRCACLGSVFNLPMSTVTIIEDLSMALMALWMLSQ